MVESPKELIMSTKTREQVVKEGFKPELLLTHR